MANKICKGDSVFIPFRNGESIRDSQLNPRMYMSRESFVNQFPGHYLGTKDVELVEYAPVVRCKDCTYCQRDMYGLYCSYMNNNPIASEAVELEHFCSHGERRDDHERKRL